MTRTVVLYPSLGAGHLAPMVHLAKLFLRRGFTVAVAVIPSPLNNRAGGNDGVDPAVARIAAANPDVTFHTLPPVEVGESDNDLFKRYVETIRLSSTVHLGDYLRSVSAAALVVDMFCTDALAVASAIGVPGYLYFTSAAGVLAAFMYVNRPDYTIGTELRMPGLPEIRAVDWPEAMERPELKTVISRIPGIKAILVNSFEWLEANAAKALRDGVCLPDRATPPDVYCIGPLVDGGNAGGGSLRHECLAWLDRQPESSVVFLCFGSMGVFPAEQLKEIAAGLEKSGHRFLWVVRGASPDGRRNNAFLPPPDLDAVLPEGFLERNRNVGMVTAWAPQQAVLQHSATAAFVTHCGWNSTLEAVAAGMPMVCWPLYAEQRLNKVFIVEDMRLGVEMVGYDKEIADAGEIEAKVRWVMESPEAEELRRRSSEAKERAAEALKDGGPLAVAFDEFIKHAAL